MSTNTRVLRSFTGLSATPVGGNAIAVVSVMDITINDATGEIKTISDNDTYHKKFNQPYEFTGSIRFEDPVKGDLLRGVNNANVSFTAIDINNGGGNVNVAMTGARFAQQGFNAASGQQGTGTIAFGGGSVTYS